MKSNYYVCDMKKILFFVVLFSSCVVTKQNKNERFCVVVEEVRFRGKHSIIRPKSQDSAYKRINIWFIYPTKNIHPGDTVDVSKKDEYYIGPNF
jgi:hypothetical protein